MSRHNSHSPSTGVGLQATLGQLELHIRQKDGEKVNEYALSGAPALQSTYNGLGLEFSYSIISSVQPDDTSKGFDRQMSRTATKITYSIGNSQQLNPCDIIHSCSSLHENPTPLL